KGRVKDSAIERILADAKTLALGLGFTVQGPSQTPFLGGKGKNPEFFMLLSNPPTPLSPVATP
ncbi:MAG: hypothetical protein LBU79_00755, partial [Planctomycetota bacterium]|nr:hypothetical protein [Planctomycetota bacterium]